MELLNFISKIFKSTNTKLSDTDKAGITAVDSPGDYITQLVKCIKDMKEWVPQTPASFDTAIPGLMPKLMPRILVERARIMSIYEKNLDPCYASKAITEHTVLTVVYDTADHAYQVTKYDLDRWKLSFSEVLSVAERNLRARTAPDFCCTTVIEGRAIDWLEGTYGTSDHDPYNATRIILTDLIRNYPVNGNCVALIPQDSMLNFYGTDHGLGGMMKYMRMSDPLKAFLTQEEFMISPVPLRLVDDHWVAEEYAASDLDLPTLYKFYLMGIYVMQKQGLKQLHDKAGISMNLETLRVHKDSSGKIDHFTVTWPDDGPVLLPAANKIQFKRKKGVSSLPALISGNWDTVSKIVGHRMKKLDLYPTLYVATSFPTKQELEKITEKST